MAAICALGTCPVTLLPVILVIPEPFVTKLVTVRVLDVLSNVKFALAPKLLESLN